MRPRIWIATCLATFAVAGLFLASAAHADVRLPKVFGDSMVLQQQMAVPVWGWAAPGEKVAVTFAGQTKTAAAGPDGKWMVRLDAMPANRTPQEMIVTGANTLTLKDVLVGEVWLCSGQSNMEMTVGGCLNLEAEKTDSAAYPMIRHIKIVHVPAAAPQADVAAGPWTACRPETVAGFPAAGYFFAREIAKELNVPVGLIGSNWGGTRIEPWTPPEGFRAVPELADVSKTVDSWNWRSEAGRQKYQDYVTRLKEWLPQAEAALAARDGAMPPIPDSPLPAPIQSTPTHLYNGMIHAIIPYAIRGALWYQGEANGREGISYFHKMQALVRGWRALWGEGDFPFYFVQLANYQRSDPNKPEGGDGWALVREAQTQSLSIPNTGMACIIDIGEAGNIHPRNKQDVGRRLALWALAKTYGRKGVVCSGPIYKSMAIEGGKVRIAFDGVGSGLMVGEKQGLDPVKETPGAKVKWIAIAGEDKVWHWADAVIEGPTLVVSSDKVVKPAAVRYAFAHNPEGANLYNKEGLPAVPFRTDAW